MPASRRPLRALSALLLVGTTGLLSGGALGAAPAHAAATGTQWFDDAADSVDALPAFRKLELSHPTVIVGPFSPTIEAVIGRRSLLADGDHLVHPSRGAASNFRRWVNWGTKGGTSCAC